MSEPAPKRGRSKYLKIGIGILAAFVIIGGAVIFLGGLMFQTNTQSESVKVSNVHTWVRSTDDASVTAFAIQNTGSKPIAINSITMRGFSSPNSAWYSCVPSPCGTLTNINTELTIDYTPSNVVLASGSTAFTAGPVGLAQGEATIVYVLNAGTLKPVDAGITYALQIQAGQASAVQQVLVVSST